MTSEALLPTALQKTLEHIIERTNKSDAGIQAILLSTTDGVPLGRVYASGQSLDEEALSSIESVWAPASKQLPLLGLKNPKQVTAMYEYGTLIHVFQMPVVSKCISNREDWLRSWINILISSIYNAGYHDSMQPTLQPRICKILWYPFALGSFRPSLHYPRPVT